MVFLCSGWPLYALSILSLGVKGVEQFDLIHTFIIWCLFSFSSWPFRNIAN